MLQPIPRSTAVGHWLTLNWLSTTTWPIAIMICRPTDDRDVGRYVKIACDLVHVTDQSGISTLRVRLEKKFVQVMKIVNHMLHLRYLMGTRLMAHWYVHCWHTTNAIDTQSTLCLTLLTYMYSDQYVHWQLTKILAYTSVDTPFMTHDRWCLCYRSKILIRCNNLIILTCNIYICDNQSLKN